MGWTVALAGNPNCGKTTLFNALTGENQYVGNWPGVTVEKREADCTLGNRPIRLVDLPGVYSLSPYSIEEEVARGFIEGKSCDAVLNIVDATCLERGLYLTLQLLEKGVAAVVALNMMDEAEKRGIHPDLEILSREAPGAGTAGPGGGGSGGKRAQIPAAAELRPGRFSGNGRGLCGAGPGPV